MSAPVRIQRQRTKGWRMPEGAVYVGRPSRWGNPWTIGRCYRHAGSRHRPHEGSPCEPLSRADAVERFRTYFRSFRSSEQRRMLAPLRGATALVCWCPLEYPDGSPCPCHADVYIKLLA